MQLAQCRSDSNAFVEYVFGVTQEPCHREWHEMWERESASVIHGAVGLGKSVQVRGKLLHMLGRNQLEQVIWLSATQRQPKKHLANIARMIEDSSPTNRLHHVFPQLRPGRIWRSTEIEIDRDVSPLDADPTIQVFGAYSDSLLGSRATVLVIDDLCNFMNTLTEDGRQKMIEWLGSVISRLTGRRVKIIVLGNFWHKNDATIDLVRNKGFKYGKYPAYRIDPATGERVLTAPSVLGHEQIAKLEERLGPTQSQQMLRCEAPDLELGRFKSVWFEAALAAGRGEPFRPNALPNVACFTGVDLGHRRKAGSDYTAMVTAMIRPDGKRQIIDVRRGRWTGPQIAEQIQDIRRRYNSVIGVENNAAQQLVLELIQDITAIPLVEHNTNVNKHYLATGVESLANELAKGFWIFPSPKHAQLDLDHGLVEDESDESDDGLTWSLGKEGQPAPEIQALIGDALAYDPTKHTGDLLMGWWICVETLRQSSVYSMLGIEAAIDAIPLDLFSR